QSLNQKYQEHHRGRHRHDYESFTMRAGIPGMVVMKPIYRNGEQGQVQMGDQIAPGQLFMRVVDLSAMELQGNINQAESELVRIGQPATIHFEAYPDLNLKGHVTAVGTLAGGGRRLNFYIRRIPVRITIEGTDPRVIPDSSASADIVVSENPETVI